MFPLSPLFAALLPQLPQPVAHSADALTRMRAHYAAAEAELREHDTSLLAPSQRGRRETLLQALRAYRERGDFGVNADYPGARVPYFVDAAGRRCAVAELLHVSGNDALVSQVATTTNHAWVAELAGDPRFQSWLDESGLSLREAARIQLPPTFIVPGGGAGGGGNGGGQSGNRPAGGSWRGPGDSVPSGGGPSGPITGAPRAGGTAAGPTASTPQPGAAVPTGGGGLGAVNSGSPSTPTLAMEVDDGWWLWWEYNKTEFLRPNALAFWRIAATGDDAAEAWRQAVARTRTEMSSVFAGALSEDDAAIRRAAVDALGKVGGSSAVPHIVRMLDDRSVEVRHHAILALGSNGAPEAVEPLLQILRAGHLAGRTERISQIASAVAICASALGRRSFAGNGFDEQFDDAVVERVKQRGRPEGESIATAAFLYQRLVPCAGLEALALQFAEDRDESPSVRCRAIEALSASGDPKVLPKLQRFVSSARMDERRSAALALGVFHDDLALPALQTAYELESEPLTRGFLLVSIGRRGGDDARKFLLDTLEKGKAQQRPWCALALGLAARNDDSPGLRKALRDGIAREKSREAHGAWWLALGLARDLEARGLLHDALLSGSDARQKMYAASALALIGDPESAALLRERMRAEDSAFLRTAYAGALGLLGMAQDAAPIAQVLSDLRDPSLQGLAASALAFHGSREALATLTSVARENSGSRLRRAAAIEGLSMMLGTTRPYSFGDVSRQANYTVFSDWFEGMLQVSL